jgi:hypothetical protein
VDDGVEEQIAAWRAFAGRRAAIATTDVDELEGHLRDQIDALSERGLAPDEAFLVAIKRMGALDELSREYAREHSERLWKQLMLTGGDPARAPRSGLVLAVCLAVGAAVAIKIPALVASMTGGDEAEMVLRNVGVLVLPFLAAFFLVTRRAPVRTITGVAIAFVLAALLVDLYPFVAGGSTLVLTAIHLVVALWLVVGIAYADGRWRSDAARMDFIRFTGEWFVYFVLLALGGGVLAGLTMAVFAAIGLDSGVFVSEWLIPCGGAGAVVIAAWLVEAKQSVVENIAPVLTKVFTPLFTALLLALIVAGLVQRNLVSGDDAASILGQRDLLIVFDVVLLVVLGLLLYSLSARAPELPAGWFDRLQLVMVIAALVVDILVLIAMIGRIGAYGASPNKIASLGLNLILLVNLAGAAWMQLGFVRHRTRFAALERWQTAYVPVYLAWAVLVAAVLPPVFDFV